MEYSRHSEMRKIPHPQRYWKAPSTGLKYYPQKQNMTHNKEDSYLRGLRIGISTFAGLVHSPGAGITLECGTHLGDTNCRKTAMAGSDVVQSGRPIFDDFFQHLRSYIGNNTANVVFQMVKRLWLIRIDQ
ncbi:hypothetical protein TNCV_2386071 [Trichonephila clavipes]|nr:hypothetical protein TNCV_2386071 [Trichonephila clavipes]